MTPPVTQGVAREHRAERCETTVDGAVIRYERFANPGCPVLLLVHGGGANRAWFHGMLPHLWEDHELLVTDLSGHGDSDHRPFGYAPELWAKELATILEVEAATSPTVVGHSMGGFVTAYLVAHWPERVGRAILIDSGVREPGPEGDDPRGRDRSTATRIYPTREAAIERFRLVPVQPVVNIGLERVVAESSIREVEGGWTWKFDPQVFQRFTDAGLHRAVRSVRRPLGLIFGEHSSGCGPATVDYLRAVIGEEIPSRCIAGAHHHVPVDRPAECAGAVRSLLAEELSVDHRDVADEASTA